MATIRKRSWENSDGDAQTVWIADYFDQHKDEKHLRGHRHIKSFPTRKAAQAWLDTTRIEVRQKIHTPRRQSITVAEAASQWLDHIENVEKRERSTVVQYRNHAARHISPLIGTAKLSDLAPKDVAAFGDALLKKLSRPMARKVLVSFKSILANARRTGKMAHSPAVDVRIGADKRQSRKLRIGVDIPMKEEIQKILAAVDQRWRQMIVTAVTTGARSSELRGLIWDRVDLKRAIVRVDQRADPWGQMGAPKSEAGDREIPLPGDVVTMLKEWKLACPNGELGLVFPNGSGNVESHANLYNRGWIAAQKAAGVVTKSGRAKYTFHSVRHFFASCLIAEGFSPKRCQVLLGHSSIKMTFDVYGHLFPDAEGDQAKVDAMVRGILA